MKTRMLTLTAIFAAITVVFTQISIPLPFTPIPFSMCILAVFLTGAILPKWYAVYAQIVYLLLGVCGLPVFGNFSGGISRLLGPTGGYLIVFPVMAFLTAWIPELFHRKSITTLGLGMLAALFVCHLSGSLWYAAVGNVGWMQALMAASIPFIPLDLVKAVIASCFATALNRRLEKAKLVPGV